MERERGREPLGLLSGGAGEAPLPIYLPGNGGLLSAVALMAGGPDPGFPDDGWRVRQEGLLSWP